MGILVRAAYLRPSARESQPSGAPALSPAGAIQLNDVYVDERRIVYAVDRHAGGLYILEMNL